ncbi:MAG: tellurium resistance protein, partial [Amylibacter sp.]
VEEAGLTLLSLESIGNYYPSPGCLSEYLYSFVGLVDLSNAQTGVHGLDTENEDIRTHFLTFDAAMALVQSGEADNGPLLLSLYWLAANRARLRGEISAA